MAILRYFLRLLCTYLPIRGRYRLADGLGGFIAPKEIDTIDLNGVAFPVDHSVPMYRYIYYGLYEENFVRFLKREIRKGDIVIEPGVNVGFITCILSGLAGNDGKVIAIEPSRICYRKIASYLNRPNIVLLNKALFDKDGVERFTDKDIVISHGYSTLSEFAEDVGNDSVYDIETVSIDSLMSSYSLSSVRLVKLDIEGAELKALYGAKEALGKKAIQFILVETTFQDKHDSVNAEIERYLTSFGYVPHLLRRNSIVPVNYKSLRNTRHDIIWTFNNS